MFVGEKHLKHKFPEYLPEPNEDFYKCVGLGENSIIFLLEFNVMVSDGVSYHRLIFYDIEELITKMSELTRFCVYVLTAGVSVKLGSIQMEEVSKIVKDATGRYFTFSENNRSQIICSEHSISGFDNAFKGTEIIFNKWQQWQRIHNR